MKWSDVITDYDNQTADTARVLAVSLIASMTLMQGWATWHSGTFDPMAFGGGCAAVLGALGVAIAGDNHRRPDGLH